MSSTPSLRRFWFKLKGDSKSPLGYGVTAWTLEDAVTLLKAAIVTEGSRPSYLVQEDIDVSALDAGHILPNMENPALRGIWFPRGLQSRSKSN